MGGEGDQCGGGGGKCLVEVSVEGVVGNWGVVINVVGERPGGRGEWREM